MIDKIEGRGLIYFNEMFVVSELKIQHSKLSSWSVSVSWYIVVHRGRGSGVCRVSISNIL